MKINDLKYRLLPALVIVLVPVILMLLLCPVSVNAAGVAGIIKGENVEVRTETPEGTVADGLVADTLNAGYDVTVISTRDASQNADRNTWIEIRYTKNGSAKTGWVRSDFVDMEGETLIEKGQVCYTDMENIPVYSEPSGIPQSEVCRLSSGYAVTVKKNGVFLGADGYSYYYVGFTAPQKYPDVTGGYIRMDHLTLKDPFQSDLEDEGFPEDYAKLLLEVHEKYPDWKFEAVYVGEGERSAYDWSDVLATESERDVNQYYSQAAASSLLGRMRRIGLTLEAGMLTATESYSDAPFEELTGAGWVSAPKSLIAYYLDPRNFITVDAVNDGTFFQFESLRRESFQNKAGVQAILSGTFMDSTCPGSGKTYAEIFMEAGDSYDISPYHLAARVRQEQGVNGTSELISGTYKGYEGLYNYYNIQASGSTTTQVITNGLKYAGASDSATLRPWNTRYKSLMGGSKFVASRYVKCSDYTPAKRYTQDTLYFQKFNVRKVNGAVVYSHQYMQNVAAPCSEAKSLKKTHTASELKNGELVFKIPVYANMPKEPCPKP